MVKVPESLTVGVLCLALAACQTAPTFPLVLDTGDTAAKVRFVTHVSGGWVDLYPEDRCNGGVNVIFEKNGFDRWVENLKGVGASQVSMIDTPDSQLVSFSEFSLKPGQMVNLGVGGVPNCLRGYSFRVEAGRQYEVGLRAYGAQGCKLAVSELTLKDGRPWREPLNTVGPMICKSAFGSR